MIIDPYRWRELPIKTVTIVAEDTVAVAFERPNDYHFKAGQYAVVRVTLPTGEQYVRQYSFSSASHSDELELLIQHEPGGNASGWFCGVARPGDMVALSQPYGGFILEETTRPVLLIAGRVGIAPFLSMIRGHTAPVSLLYSVRNNDQICFPDELARASATIVNTGEVARINEQLLRPHLQHSPLVFVCGSKKFVDGIVTTLHTLNIADKDIRRELFTLQ